MKVNKIYNEDCMETMLKMPDNFVDLVIASPPYDDMRTYNADIDKIWGEYIWKPIIKKLYRITKNNGVVIWIVGDATKNFCESLSSFRQAIYFVETCKFNLLDTMIYHKLNYPPTYPGTRRYAQVFEYMFVFSKGKPKTFNPVRWNKKKTYTNKSSSFRQKDGSQIKKRIDGTKKTKAACNVWSMSTHKSKDAGDHPAVFPESLARDHILTWSNKNDLVYDPFMGSGTTAKMAILNNRNFIGSEISKEYCDIANKRIELTQEKII